MSTTVTLNVFSGRPNPTFQLDDKQSDELAERLKGLQSFTEQRPSGAFGGLGYRGFSVSRSHTHPEGALDLRVHEGIVEQGLHAANLTDEAELEHWLAQLAQPHLAPEVAEHLSQVLQPANRLRFPFPPLKLACPANHAHDAPAYNPGLWNVPSVQPHNNCYNYANNQITNTFAQPGRATGHQATVMACPNVQAGATSDGLHATPNFSAPLAAGQGWYVALVIWPNTDYHWYRQDNVGCWSHKPGQTAARNVDNAGHAISDPRTCNRGPYTVFCTYMVTKKGVHIR